MIATKASFGVADLADLLSQSPVPRARVLAGPADRFRDLFGWEELLAILDRHGMDVVQRLRIVKNGTVLPQDDFAAPPKPGAAWGPRVSPERVNRLCAEGASLVLNGVRDYSPRLDALARQLEAHRQAPVSANAYFTPPGNRAFGVHYDPYDVIVLQILGAKRWQTFGPRTPAPLLDDRVDFKNPPERPDLEHTLCAGEILYVPRGVWHVASTAETGGSLHLTLGVRHRTYADVLEQLVVRLKAAEGARVVLPRSESEVHAAVEELFRQAMLHLPDVLRELGDAVAPPADGFTLPRPG
jgi:hypothetical protein